MPVGVRAAAAAMPEDPAQHPGAVTSPMVGTCYLAAEPGASPFVTVGATVSTMIRTVLSVLAPSTFRLPAASAKRSTTPPYG